MKIEKLFFVFLFCLNSLYSQIESHILVQGLENYFCSLLDFKPSIKNRFQGEWTVKNDSVFYTPSDTNIVLYNKNKYYIVSPEKITISFTSSFLYRYQIEDKDCAYFESSRKQKCIEERTLILQWMDRHPDLYLKNQLLPVIDLKIAGYLLIDSFRVKIMHLQTEKANEICYGNNFSYNILKTMLQYDPKDIEIIIDQVKINLPGNHIVKYPQELLFDLK